MTDARPARTYRVRYIGFGGEDHSQHVTTREIDAEVTQIVGNGLLFAFCMPKRIIPSEWDRFQGARTEAKVIWVHTLIIPFNHLIDCELIRDDSDHSLSADEDVIRRYPAMVPADGEVVVN